MKTPAIVCALFLLSTHVPVFAQTPYTGISSALYLSLPEDFYDSPATPNPVEGMIVQGAWKSPAAGEQVAFPCGTSTWRTIKAGPDGWFPDSLIQRPCYIYATYVADRDTVMLFNEFGNDIVFINGVARPGNPYAYKDQYDLWEPRFDYGQLPVALNKGENHILCKVSRGRMKMFMSPAPSHALFNIHDLTLPDAVVGKPLTASAAIEVINPTQHKLHSGSIRYVLDGSAHTSVLPDVPPMTVRKVPFTVAVKQRRAKGNIDVRLALESAGKTIDTATIVLRVVEPTDAQRVTFISEIDGSVQYYGLLPPQGSTAGLKALVFSLHGAGVEAINQASSYEPKPWAWLVAPTNRRPYGFNWEDWGRLDAKEVLERAFREYPVDQSRVYLTGHSMGGHGTWQLGAHWADQFAAIGPSAGWITYWSYRIKDRTQDTTAVARMFRRASGTSETPLFARNYSDLGIYIIHGSADDNVPVQQTYLMLDTLRTLHPDLMYHEEPGAGHWWDKSPEPGADCVDWAPMFDFFAHHRRAAMTEYRFVDFVTANPAVGSKKAWVTVISQEHALTMSEVHLNVEPGLRTFSGTTKNVHRMDLDLSVLSVRDSLTVDIDGSRLSGIHPLKNATVLSLVRSGGGWTVGSPVASDEKNPARNGMFKDAFRRRFVMVYGTHGTPETNRLLYQQVRYDAEKFWYQGNGSADVVPDTLYRDDSHRNVILYGNETNNLVFRSLLKDSPIRVAEGAVSVDAKEVRGGDMCAAFVVPRKDTPNGQIGVVAATGDEGIRLLSRLQYFNAYLGMPDVTILRANVVTEGESGVLLLGFFGNDWTVKNGDLIGQMSTH